jgi:hypothetical protein
MLKHLSRKPDHRLPWRHSVAGKSHSADDCRAEHIAGEQNSSRRV